MAPAKQVALPIWPYNKEKMANSDTNQLLRAFVVSGYTLRSGPGLLRDAQLPPDKFQMVLSNAISEQLVDQVTGNDGTPRFFLTKDGRIKLANMLDVPGTQARPAQP